MNKHVWRFRWKVSETDLSEGDLWVEAAIRRAAIAGVNPGVFGKSKLTANAGLVVNVPDVDIVDALGRVLDVTSTTADLSTDEGSVSTDPPGGQTRWVVVAIEYAVDSTNSQTDPVLGTPFNFHNLDSYTIRVVAGAATAGTPVPPNVGNGIITGGVILTSGQSTITQGNLDDGEDALIHTDKVMRRGALERIDTVYLDADLGTLTSVVDLQELLEIISTKIGEKTDKAVPSASGNFAGLDASGNLIDTTIAPADKADTSALTAHTGNTSNPHVVTRTQLDVYSTTEVDTLVDASLAPPEAYDPTGTGNYPTTFSGGAILGGHSFRITAAKVNIGGGSVTVNVEDLLIALQDSPSATNDAHWMVAESNRDQATESLKGVAKLGTQAEVDAGTNDTDIITPLKLRTSVATEARPGVAEIATQVEVDTGSDNNRFITALKLAGSALATAVGLNTAKVTNSAHPGGDVTGSAALAIGANKVTLLHLAHGGADEVFGTDGGGLPTLAKIPTAKIGDNQVTLGKIAHGGSNLLFGTDGSGVPELALLQTEQVADDAITEAKVSGAVARWLAGGTTAISGLEAGSHSVRKGFITWLGDAAFPAGPNTNFQIRRNGGANSGEYHIAPPYDVSDLVTLYDNTNCILIIVPINTTMFKATWLALTPDLWLISMNNHLGVLTDAAFSLTILQIDNDL